jgi:hypothetical protein
MDDSYDAHQKARDEFRQRLLASNLADSKRLMKLFAEEDDDTHAQMVDFDDHGFRPEAHSAEELEDVMADLKGLGFSLSEMEG